MINMPNISEKEAICSLQPNNEFVGMFLTVAEVANILVVSRDTIYRLLDKRKLAYHSIGGCKRIHKDDLKLYLDENRRQTNNEDDYGYSEN